MSAMECDGCFTAMNANDFKQILRPRDETLLRTAARKSCGMRCGFALCRFRVPGRALCACAPVCLCACDTHV
jgi:hypothetical protein